MRTSLVTLFLSGLLTACLWAAASHATGLFGSSERETNGGFDKFPKWTGMLDRHPRDLATMEKGCEGKGDACLYGKWQRFLDSVRSATRSEQIRRVNAFHNENPYIEDSINWGMRDYWETVYEFFLKHGDCEDYAISKYMSLKALGFEEDDLRIVVLNDTNLRVLHSVLAVYDDGEIYILDNQIKSVIAHSKIRHYQPVFSINQRAWWRHTPRS